METPGGKWVAALGLGVVWARRYAVDRQPLGCGGGGVTGVTEV